jgi:hypothetical protein
VKAAHVFVDFGGPRPPVTFAPENQLVCRCDNCGDRYVLGLPVSVTMAALVMKWGEAVTFDELAELAEEAAAAQGVDLKPVTNLWRQCIKVGAMSDAEAVEAFTQLALENQLPS